MPLFSSRDDFYSALWEDYRECFKTVRSEDGVSDKVVESDVSKSFYYCYIKKKKDIAADEIAAEKQRLTEYSKQKRLTNIPFCTGRTPLLKGR